VTRTSRNTLPQAQTRTALFAYLAARLNDVSADDFDRFFISEGLLIRKAAALAAGSSAKHRPQSKKRRGPRTSKPPPRPPTRPGFREWTLVDELALELDVALVRFPGAGTRQSRLIHALAKLAGVRQIIETARDRDVLAILVCLNARHRRELRAQLEELAEQMVWDEITLESHEPTRGTWRMLAAKMAYEEGLDTLP